MSSARPEPGRENAACPRYFDQAMAAIAATQHTLLRLDQLRALGLAARSVQDRAATGRLHRVYQGVYSLVPPALLTREARWLAAVFACGPGAVLSHRTAAALHQLRRWGHTKVEVTVPRRSARQHAGILVHRSIALTAGDVTEVNGIPCTTVARTLLDLAGVAPRRHVERAFDEAETFEKLDLRAIEDQLARNPTRREAGLIEAILATHRIGSTLTASELEEKGLAMTRMCGIPDPDIGVYIDPHDGEPSIKRDLVWRVHRIVLEIDSYKYHRGRAAFNRDRRNDRRLTVAGWKPLRATDVQLEDEPLEVGAAVLRLMSG